MALKLFRPSNWTKRRVSFYLLFHGVHVALFIYGWWKQARDPRLAALNKLTYSVWISRGAGLALSLDSSPLLIPMCRETLGWLRPKMRWLRLEEFEWFHRQVAYSLLFYTCVHVSSHYVNFYNVEKLRLRQIRAVQIHYTQAGGITGHVMLLCMFLMYTSAHVKIRRQSYEGFWYIHHLFIIFYLSLLTHATGCFVRDSVGPYSPFAGAPFWKHCIGYQSWRWEVVFVIVYFFERVYRFINSRRPAEIDRVFQHPSKVLEIQFHKRGMKYKAGQWLLLKCPAISNNQWHPFTISSCPFDPYVSVHIRQVGDFTGAFSGVLASGAEQYRGDSTDPLLVCELMLRPGQRMPSIHIDGPYGSPAEDIFQNEAAIIIGCGIGITPWASILKQIWHVRETPRLSASQRLRRVDFIWVCKDFTNYQWFHKLINTLERQSMDRPPAACRPLLRCRTYITRDLHPDSLGNAAVPVAGEPPVSPVEFQKRMNHGRPDFVQEFQVIRDEILFPETHSTGGREARAVVVKKKNKVGVYYCGPNAPGRAIRQACKEVTSKELKFKFWKEHSVA